MEAEHENIQAEVARLIAELKSKSTRRREQAKRGLLLIGSPAVEPLLDLLRQQRPPITKVNLLLLLVVGICIGLPFASTIDIEPFAWCIFLTVVTLLPVMIRLQTATGTQIDAAHILAQIEDVRAVGPLIDSLDYRDAIRSSHTRTIASKALVRLLPRLRASDAALLNARQRQCLARYLNPYKAYTNRSLILAILTALEQIGDRGAIPNVQRLVDGIRPYAKDEELRTAARNCLLFLQQQAQSDQAQQTLLRPAVPSSDGQNTLLRPGIEPAQTNPRELLRSSSDND